MVTWRMQLDAVPPEPRLRWAPALLVVVSELSFARLVGGIDLFVYGCVRGVVVGPLDHTNAWRWFSFETATASREKASRGVGRWG